MTVSPIVVNDIQLTIEYPNIDYLDWKYYNNGLKDIYLELKTILRCINIKHLYTTRKNYKGAVMDINSYTYHNYMKSYYWYLLHIDNPIEYNIWFDKLINLHKNNIEFCERLEFLNTIAVGKTKTGKVRKGKIKPKNKWYRETKVDMFTNKEVYTYYNPVTGDSFISDNPDELDRLNEKHDNRGKKRKVVEQGVPLEHMTFNFNIK